MEDNIQEDGYIVHWKESLKQLDHDLNNRYEEYYNEEVGLITKQVFRFGPYKRSKYSMKELDAMLERKHTLVTQLHDAGYISAEGYCDFMLSTDMCFTPPIINPNSPLQDGTQP